MRFLLSEMFIIKGVIQVQDFYVYNTLPCNKSLILKCIFIDLPILAGIY